MASSEYDLARDSKDCKSWTCQNYMVGREGSFNNFWFSQKKYVKVDMWGTLGLFGLYSLGSTLHFTPLPHVVPQYYRLCRVRSTHIAITHLNNSCLY